MLGYTVADNYQKKEKSWNKSAKKFSFKTSKIQYLNFETEEEVEKCWMKNDKNSLNNSTLSLHIAAYENSVEVDSKEVYDLPKKTGAIKHIDSLIKWQSLRDSFEFPRQMDGNKPPTAPEVQQFAASQKLISPNQGSSSNKTQPAAMSSNRRGSSSSNGSGCPECAQLSLLEIEAISAVKEVSAFVQSICISEVLSRTPDLIFLNLHTLEGDTYCIELTQRGWRVCSNREDCMNGDFRKLDFHSRYFETIYQLLDVISPLYREQYAKALTTKLNQLSTAASSSSDSSPPPPQSEDGTKTSGNEKK